MQEIVEAFPLLADQIVLRHPQSVEKDRIRIDGLAPHLIDLAHLRCAAPVEIGIEKRKPFGGFCAFLFRRRASEQQDLVCALRRRRPHLAAMNDILIPVPLGPC